MEGAANSNAGLMRRIVQLEAEKNELQQDIESLCMQQSGTSGSNDIVSRMQSRRIAGFEQELEVCKQKLAFHTKEGLNLQEELAETYRAKGRVADAYKAAMDKNKELEKEVNFYQSRMAGAFAERDKALLEVERLYASEKSMTKELRDLRHRLEQIRTQCQEQEKIHFELERNMESSSSELERVQKVVQKFWQLREAAMEDENRQDEFLDKAQILLEENDQHWVYRLAADITSEQASRGAEIVSEEVREELTLSKAASAKLEEELSLTESTAAKVVEELALSKSVSAKLNEELSSTKSKSTKLEEELASVEATVADLKLQLDKERLSRKDAEDKTAMLVNELALKRIAIERECRHLRAQQVALKKMASVFLEAETRQVLLVGQSVQQLLERVKSTAVQEKIEENIRCDVEENTNNAVGPDTPSESRGLEGSFEEEGASPGTSVGKEVSNHNSGQDILNISEAESRQILAQAMQEKVEALLLLSQQEERYYLEKSTQSALESQVTLLNKKLTQVTTEKIKALIDLAQGREQIQRLQDRERDLVHQLEQRINVQRDGSIGPPATGTITSYANENLSMVKQKQKLTTATGGYIRGWLRGLDLSGFKATSGVATSSTVVTNVTTTGNKGDNGNSISRLLVENTALQERIMGIQHLATSAHRLRMILAKVAAESQADLPLQSIQSAIEVVESLKSEAKQLALARGNSLPVSFQGPPEGSLDNLVRTSTEAILEGGNGEAEGSPGRDSVYVIAMEVTELLLALAELQTESLVTKLNLASID